MKPLLTVICAWCGKDMGTKPGQGQTGITHGICDECIEKELAQVQNICGSSSVEERLFAKEETAGSNPVFRSKKE